MIQMLDIQHRYGKHMVFNNFQFSVGAGVHGLLGPNGAGKTTLLRILATLHAPQQGQVSILGLNPQKHHERLELRRQLGYLPQDFMPYPQFSAFEFVEYIAILKGMKNITQRRKKVLEVLAAVGLESEAHRKAGGFSGGMRRRLGIAQAIVNDPALLVVDEPTAGLDPAERIRFRLLLTSTQAKCTILSTHIVEDVTAVAPLLSVLNKGQLLYQGTAGGLTTHAAGQVFLSNEPVGTVIARVGNQHRVLTQEKNLGTSLEPSVEEGYLALIGRAA